MGSKGQQPLTHRNVVPSPMACRAGSRQHQGQCLSWAPNSRVDRPGATVWLCASETHSQAGNRDSLKSGKEKPDQMCCSFEEPSFLGTVGQRKAVGEAAKHLLWGQGRDPGTMSASTWASGAEGLQTWC